MSLGINQCIARRAVLRASPGYMANMVIFFGFPFFLLVAAITGDLLQMGRYSWQSYAIFSFAGLVQFTFGRTWFYKSIKLIGATRSNPVINLNIIIVVVLALVLFHEPITLLTVVGIMLAITGPFLIAVKEPTDDARLQSKADLRTIDRRTLYRGTLYGLGCAVLFGSGTISVKLGLNYGGSPVIGSLVAFLASSIAIIPSVFFNAENRRELLSPSKHALVFGLLCGLATSVAIMMTYGALYYGPVIVVSLVQRTLPIWALLFAFAVNRKNESLSRWVLAGNGVLMAGVILILV
ncbi:MAG: DMT family transporter [Chloroflexi bacterium]|nr:DMT family transporter [Chloroflexota bacterium]